MKACNVLYTSPRFIMLEHLVRDPRGIQLCTADEKDVVTEANSGRLRAASRISECSLPGNQSLSTRSSSIERDPPRCQSLEWPGREGEGLCGWQLQALVHMGENGFVLFFRLLALVPGLSVTEQYALYVCSPGSEYCSHDRIEHLDTGASFRVSSQCPCTPRPGAGATPPVAVGCRGKNIPGPPRGRKPVGSLAPRKITAGYYHTKNRRLRRAFLIIIHRPPRNRPWRG